MLPWLRKAHPQLCREAPDATKPPLLPWPEFGETLAQVRQKQQEERLCKAQQSCEPARLVFQRHLCVSWHLGSNYAFPRAMVEVKHFRRGWESSKTRQLRSSPCSCMPGSHLPFTNSRGSKLQSTRGSDASAAGSTRRLPWKTRGLVEG